MPYFSSRSIEKLASVDSHLQNLFGLVVKDFDCTVVSGLRTVQEQQLLYAQGRTMPGPIITNIDGVNKLSRHQSGRAVDVVPYPIDWNDRDRFYHFAGYVKGIALSMGIRVVWGGDWDSDYVLDDQSFYDLPHYELG
jgi:peptidoglycan L-alanyl-D-glutamate endopeptidase CwlK